MVAGMNDVFIFGHTINKLIDLVSLYLIVWVIKAAF